ncbi:MAG TPA: DUF4126 domain-containing protein [Bryobacteraceae bacterium]|nr:DUF4126 domain-containing protein [Bryobacteraceae bacterium]
MDWLGTWGVAMGTAWLSGFRLYAAVLTLGLLQHYHFANLPGELHFFGEWWIIAVAGLLCLTEFIADKIPAIDSGWDAVHTFIRVPAGAVLAAAAFGQFDSRVRVLAFLLGGGIALTAHGTKATTRLAVNTSPEPFSNIAVSTLEDAGGVGLSLLTVFHPVVMLFIVGALGVVGILIIRKLARAIRGLFQRLRFSPSRPTRA